MFWGVLKKFWGEFWVYLGGESFFEKIGKIKRNKKYRRFNVVLKLEFEIKNYYMDTQTVPYQPGCSCLGSTVWWCS